MAAGLGGTALMGRISNVQVPEPGVIILLETMLLGAGVWRKVLA